MEKEISLTQLFSKIFKRKLLVLIITFSVLLLVLIAGFVFNNLKKTVKSEFQISFNNIESGRYLDGTAFNFRYIISEQFLGEVVNSDSQFESIDPKKLSVDLETNIVQQIVEISSVTSSGETVNEYHYTLTFPGKNFSNEKQARNFILAIQDEYLKRVYQRNEDVASIIPLNELIAPDTEYLFYSDVFRTYFEIVERSHNEFIWANGNVIYDGINLRDEYSKFLNWYNNSLDVGAFEGEVQGKAIIKDADNDFVAMLANLNVKKTNLENQIAALSALLTPSIVIALDNDAFKNLVSLQNELSSTILKMATIAELESRGATNSDFDAKAATLMKEFQAYADNFAKVINGAYNLETLFEFENNKAMVIDNPLNIILIGMVGLVLGLTVGCTVSYIVDVKKQKNT